MKVFSYFILILILLATTLSSFYFLDPGEKNNIHFIHVLITSLSLSLLTSTIYLFINSIFTSYKNIFTFLRSFFIGIIIGIIFVLNILSLLNWISLIIICIIYILCEIILFEIQK